MKTFSKTKRINWAISAYNTHGTVKEFPSFVWLLIKVVAGKDY